VVGLYHNPPERAVVLCVDEKSGMQALDRSQPVLPPLTLPGMPGMPERRTHDYVRHGTSSLFPELINTAFNIADGTVISEIHRQHRAVESAPVHRKVSPIRPSPTLTKLDRTVPETHRRGSLLRVDQACGYRAGPGLPERRGRSVAVCAGCRGSRVGPHRERLIVDHRPVAAASSRRPAQPDRAALQGQLSTRSSPDLDQLCRRGVVW
jgi:hypothetical protein